LINPDNSFSPSWSPDGRHLAYKHWDAEKGLESLHLVQLSEDSNGTIWPVSDVILMDSESFGDFFGGICFSKTQNTIYFPGRGAVWALDLDDEMNPLGEPEPIFTIGVESYRVSASAEDALFAFDFWSGEPPSSIVLMHRDDSLAPIVIDAGSYPSFKR
jgi:hypothetical protein